MPHIPSLRKPAPGYYVISVTCYPTQIPARTAIFMSRPPRLPASSPVCISTRGGLYGRFSPTPPIPSSSRCTAGYVIFHVRLRPRPPAPSPQPAIWVRLQRQGWLSMLVVCPTRQRRREKSARMARWLFLSLPLPAVPQATRRPQR